MKKCTALLLLLCLLASLLPTALADAADVTAMIAAIPSAAIENEAAIDAAYMAYYQLPEEERAAVTNWDTLLALREELPKAYVVGERQGTRVPWHKLRIGTYGFAGVLWNDEDMKTLADCGIDFIVQGHNPTTDKMDLAYKYGVGLFFHRGNFGIPTEQYSDFGNPAIGIEPLSEQELRDILEAIEDHPALWGFEMVDEPHAMGFEQIGKDLPIFADVLPDWMPYINLYPMTDMKRLGTVSYEKHIRLLHENADLDFGCVDHYTYGSNGDGTLTSNFTQFTTILDILSRVNTEFGKETWMVIQAGTFEKSDTPLDSKRLKLQAYTCLAFGAKSINWACWSDNEFGSWFYNCPTNDSGNPGKIYNDLQSINADLHALGPVFMRYTYDASCAIGYAATAHERMLERDPGAYLGHLVNTPEEVHDLTYADEAFNDNDYMASLGVLPAQSSAYDAWPGHQSTTQNWAFDSQYTTTHDVSMGQDTFLNLATDGKQDAVLVGHFTKNVGEGEAIMLVNVSNPNFARFTGTSILKPYTEINPTVTFTVNKENPVVTLYVKGVPSILEPVDGVYSVTLNMEDAAFITVD